jgi:hypothetical protein
LITGILPMVPYLDTLRRAFVAVALGGVAVSIYARPDDRKRGATVIAAVLRSLGGWAWTRTALRFGVTALAIILFPLSLRRSGART